MCSSPNVTLKVNPILVINEYSLPDNPERSWNSICHCCGYQGLAKTNIISYPICEACGERHEYPYKKDPSDGK